jgi:oxygen-dependent protoporphyrinogen oxidase
LNFGAHVLGGPDSATGRLLASLGVRAVDVPGVLTALALDDTLLAGTRVETYPFQLPLNAADRLALIQAGAKLRLAVERYRRVAARRAGEAERTRRERVLGFRDDRTFAQFLGHLPERVDGIFRATIRRSAGEPEEVSAGYGIGYFQLVWDRSQGLTRNIVGGSGLLPQAISDRLGERVNTNCEVEQVAPHGDAVGVRFRDGDGSHEVRARFVVVATPAHVTRKIVAGLPPQTEHALAGITYGPYVVGAFLTRETHRMPYDQGRRHVDGVRRGAASPALGRS